MNRLSHEDRDKYGADLLDTLRRIDLLESEKKETSKTIKAAIDEEWSRVRVLRDLLEGRISQQTALPGLEGPSERKNRIGAVLRRAVEAVQRITQVDVIPDPNDDPAASALEEAREAEARRRREKGH